jgi:3-(methylthio)propanoyl-CoA dehydrogenase
MPVCAAAVRGRAYLGETLVTYTAPIAEQLFVLETIAAIDKMTGQRANAGFDRDLVSTVLEAGGRLTAELFAPLNTVGDKEGLIWSPQGVRHPAGFAEAYATYVKGDWQTLSANHSFANYVGVIAYGSAHVAHCYPS